MADYMDQIIKNEEITLLNDVVNRLSYGLIMENCIINFKLTGRALICTQAHFINCTLNFKTKLINYPFTTSLFEGCTFKGKFVGGEFGHRVWIHDPAYEKIKANIKNCDFSEVAFFDGIRFIDCDISVIKFPKFPHFVIKYPKKNYKSLINSDLPEKFKSLITDQTWVMDTDNAFLFNADRLSKDCNISIEELKYLLSKYDFIEM